MDDDAYNPAHIPAPASYHWTLALQRDFLESLAANGSVKISAAKVGMSPSSVYQLKQRPEGAAFKLGCAAAVLIARGRLVDELLDRAIWGHDETAELLREEGRSFAKRRRIDSRLGLAMLARLDKMVETRARAGEEMFAQLIAGDWTGFLSLFDVEGEGHNAALALWLAGRDNRANPLASLWRDTPIANEVAQFSATIDGEPDAEPTPEEAAAAMSVWPDADTGELRTNFPPPADYLGIEEGRFGDEDYERTLDPDEEEAFDAACEAAFAPLKRAGEAARRAFFGLPTPANDPAPEKHTKIARSAAS
ncbi:hypothetical protein CVO77_16370 [Sphingopyxis lindanitolerans]|uniref:Uncharacterized protein n=1 Tax=Sphingopyxis lindanitolerans TaxID=2054227 RepID=A0A2S8B2U5_9SPHN|nr:hypothetical protein [Sphingopyxis lindanitolerans]PQM26589.1 hypothetical protein CVO77_16370 [Sphingopyxis lindanitolerans]